MQYNINHVYCSLRDRINLICCSCATDRYCLESNRIKTLLGSCISTCVGQGRREGGARCAGAIPGCWGSMRERQPGQGSPCSGCSGSGESPALPGRGRDCPWTLSIPRVGQGVCVFKWVWSCVCVVNLTRALLNPNTKIQSGGAARMSKASYLLPPSFRPCFYFVVLIAPFVSNLGTEFLSCIQYWCPTSL